MRAVNGVDVPLPSSSTRPSSKSGHLNGKLLKPPPAITRTNSGQKTSPPKMIHRKTPNFLGSPDLIATARNSRAAYDLPRKARHSQPLFLPDQNQLSPSSSSLHFNGCEHPLSAGLTTSLFSLRPLVRPILRGMVGSRRPLSCR